MEKVKDPPEKRDKIFLKSGAELTPELEEELAAEAERGYDLSKARQWLLERPLLADDASRPQVTFSLSRDELDALQERAESEGLSIQDVIREALRRYMDS